MKTKDGWRVVCGTSAGDLYVFDENKEVVTAVEGAHSGAVLSMCDVGGEDHSGGGSGGGSGSAAAAVKLVCGCLLLTGGKDGMVKIWNQSLQPVSIFDANPYALVDGAIGSVDIYQLDGVTRVLCGTYGGEILEVTLPESGGSSKSGGNNAGNALNTDFTNARAQVLLYSHYKGELWGLATHPLDADIYATVGDEGSLRVWSISTNSLLASTLLYWPARTVTWNHSGTVLAVGFHEAVKGGGGKGKGTKAADGEGEKDSEGKQHVGAVHLYSFNRLQALAASSSGGGKPGGRGAASGILVKRADGCSLTNAWISDLKFSPDDLSLAIASHDKKMYVYSLPEVPSPFLLSATVPGTPPDMSGWGDAWTQCLGTAKPRFIFNKHSSAVLHLDYSRDGKYIQTNCQAYEYLFCDAATGKQETSASKLADYNNAISCQDAEEEEELLKQWETQTCVLGWPVQGIWPVGADGSDINAADRILSHKYIATADDFGLVKVFRYPSVKESSKCVAGTGHSSHVTSVRWAQINNTGTAAGTTGAATGVEYLISTGGNDKCIFVWEIKEK